MEEKAEPLGMGYHRMKKQTDQTKVIKRKTKTDKEK